MGERLWSELQVDSAWLGRLQGVQQQLLSTYGIPLPSLEITLSRQLDSCTYRFRLAGSLWEQGQLYPGRWFATGEPACVEMLMGEMAQEPVYGLDGRWIPESRAEGARQLGCHLLAPQALWVGHLCDRIESRLHLCLSGDWLERRLKRLGLVSPGPGLFQILTQLLEERLSLAPLSEIVHAYRSAPGDMQRKLRRVRRALGPRLVTPWLNQAGQLMAVNLSDSIALRLRRELAREDGPEGWFLSQFMLQLQGELLWAQHHHGEVVLLVSAGLRRDLFELLPFELRRIPVLAFDEIPPDVECVAAAVVGSRVHPLVAHWPGQRWESTPPLASLVRIPDVNEV